MVIAARAEVANEIEKLIVYGRRVVITSVRDAIELRHRLHSAQPKVVLLDQWLSREFSVLAAVKRMELIRSRPSVVLITDDSKASTLRRAQSAGCHLVLERRKGWERSLAAALTMALVAQRSRLQAERAASARERVSLAA